MPIITDVVSFNGVAERIARLGLAELYDEVLDSLTFELAVEERRHANGTKPIRQWIDQRFEQMGRWKGLKSEGVDWKATAPTGASIAVEVQVSGRSDMLAVDVLHLCQEIRLGRVEVGVIIVPDDRISRFLTDRTPNMATALKHIRANASDQPLRVLAFSHDTIGAAVPKMVTNLGRGSSIRF